MIRRPPGPTLTDTRFPYKTLFRSPTKPVVPVATSVIQDGDSNNALDAVSSVRITSGDPGAGAPGDGNITIFEGVEIVRSIGTAPLTFQLDANRAIFGADFSIEIGRAHV